MSVGRPTLSPFVPRSGHPAATRERFYITSIMGESAPHPLEWSTTTRSVINRNILWIRPTDIIPLTCPSLLSLSYHASQQSVSHPRSTTSQLMCPLSSKLTSPSLSSPLLSSLPFRRRRRQSQPLCAPLAANPKCVTINLFNVNCTALYPYLNRISARTRCTSCWWQPTNK